MYAVIDSGGKQVTVREGDLVRVERVDGSPGDRITLSRVLLIGEGETRVGTPTIEGASVQARIVRQARGRKIIVMKYKSKAHYRRKTGHRQDFTELRIESIAAPAG